MRRFADRTEAGKVLAEQLQEYTGRSDLLVLALPRGGVPVAYEIATALHAPLDIFNVRKIGTPWNEELGVGAIASGGITVIDRAMVAELNISPAMLDIVIQRELKELHRRDTLYRGSRPPPDVAGRAVILVDDGLATGSTMVAAVAAAQQRQASQVIVAVPVASREACDMLSMSADRCICAVAPEPFWGVGMWYEDFSQTSDDEVLELFQRSATSNSPATIA